MAATRSEDDDIIAGINVTPLVDIALVLLVVLLVTAKAVVSPALPITPPASAHATDVQSPLTLELGADGRVFLGGAPAASDEAIVAAAGAAHARDPEVRVIVRADGAVPHARVIRAMNLLKDGGVTHIAFGVAPGQVAAPLVAP